MGTIWGKEPGGGGDPRAQAASPTLGLVRWPWAVSCSLWALVFREAGPSLAFFLRVLGRAGSCGSPCKWLLALGRFLWQTEGHLPPWLTQAEGHSKLGTQNPTRAGGGLVPPSISFPGCCLPLSLLPSHPLIQGCSLGSYALQTPPPAVRPHLFSPISHFLPIQCLFFPYPIFPPQDQRHLLCLLPCKFPGSPLMSTQGISQFAPTHEVFSHSSRPKGTAAALPSLTA